jgi:S1-C subfamily serine protease
LPNLTLVKENSVQVQNPHPGMTPGLGSGAIVNMPHDHGAPTKVILTAAHMVQGHVVGDTVTIVSDKTGQTYQTQILAINSGTDLAELALPQQLAGAPGFQLAPGDAHPNDHIFSVAHPAGSTNLEVSPGIAGPNFPASNQPRPDAVLPNTTLQGAFMVIAQGSSGGEVLDSRGRLVGLADATWGVTTVPSPSGAAAVGYNTTIVPVSTIKRSFR